ncbi:hypothetical protein [Streptomyces zaomyceticus]|uniref:hypothetical protein n=1 Tax=Streptomyces zaomyceticus TaxID=68286 RepID=UPI00369C537A
MTAGISLAKPAQAATTQASARRYVQRAELALGLPDYKALASLGLSPDPLQQLAAAMASVRTEDGEKAGPSSTWSLSPSAAWPVAVAA